MPTSITLKVLHDIVQIALDAMADPTHPEPAEITESLDGYDPTEIEELPLKIAPPSYRQPPQRRTKAPDKTRRLIAFKDQPKSTAAFA